MKSAAGQRTAAPCRARAALPQSWGRSPAGAVHLGRLAGGPATHALEAARELAAPRARAVREGLVPFLRANAAELAAPAERLCHADLKPENLLVRGDAVWLLDFERACFADPAWELACAMDRLGLDAAGRHALLLGWSAERVDPEVAVRAQLFRLAWQVALPPAVAAFTRDTGRRPSNRARRLVAAAQRRGAALLAALTRLRAGLGRPSPRVR